MSKKPIKIDSTVPKVRQNVLKWHGWGYLDTKFDFDSQKKVIYFTGNKYPIDKLELPLFTDLVKNKLGIDFEQSSHAKSLHDFSNQAPPSLISSQLESLIRNQLKFEYSLKAEDRLHRSHGQTLNEIFRVRQLNLTRIPDIVIWPKCHQDVEKLVQFAQENCLVLIPYGGGTSVTNAVTCPNSEQRPIISVDLGLMNRLIWIDKQNLTVCCESGVLGQDLERKLRQFGFTCGHEPDSYEFSTVGGWIATRASGMKKNTYGNIEDLLIDVRIVTAVSTIHPHNTKTLAPRVSCGPNFQHLILGSEGTLGIITEAVLKIRPVPTYRKFGSILFEDFNTGLKFCREVARQRCQPSSIRLMDNDQFQFGQCFQESKTSLSNLFKHAYVKWYWKFDFDKVALVTLLFEDYSKENLENQEQKIYRISKKFAGLKAGEKNGERGYMLTFTIAYIRDIALDYYVVAESFETSVAWDRAANLCENVKQTIITECTKHQIQHYLISCRCAQTYDSGCCIYFYFAFNYKTIKTFDNSDPDPDPVHLYELLEQSAREEILNSGGTLSHHHGVGKIRKQWYPQCVSNTGVNLFQAIKQQLDPNNIFANNNLINFNSKL